MNWLLVVRQTRGQRGGAELDAVVCLSPAGSCVFGAEVSHSVTTQELNIIIQI
jgi:hypothetical protein